jgi:alcohol dehydrogenase (NADP+)
MGYREGVSRHFLSASVSRPLTVLASNCVLPKSKTESRIKQNLEGDFELSAEDVKKIDGIDKKFRFNDPSANFNWNFYADLDGKTS